MREELSKVGAGVIGNYNQCSFGLVGEGTFFGNENANPGNSKKKKKNNLPLGLNCKARSYALYKINLKKEKRVEKREED